MLKKGCYPLGYPGLDDSCAQIGNCTIIKIILLTMIPDDGVKGHAYSYVSGQCCQTIASVVPTKSDSDVILCLQLPSKTLTCTLHFS